MKMLNSNDKGDTLEALNNGLQLFRMEFFKNVKPKKARNCTLHNDEVLDAWRALTDKERKEYTDKAKHTIKEKKQRPKKAVPKRKIPFFTRCSIRQFKQLVDFIHEDERLKEKVKRLGFSKLLDVGDCKKLTKDLIVSMVRCYNPPTHQFRIRGKACEIFAVHVEKLLGLPHSRNEVSENVDDNDPIYEKLKRDYSNQLYSDILKDIASLKENDDGEGNFELLFMLYTLGTFLSPSSSPTVSNRLLKVMRSTMNGFEKFDWVTYIIKDLWKEMEDFVGEMRKKKDGNSNIGGCVYLLLGNGDIVG